MNKIRTRLTINLDIKINLDLKQNITWNKTKKEQTETQFFKTYYWNRVLIMCDNKW